MLTGFSFKGTHSRDMPVVMATKTRPILPEMKRVTMEADAADGVIDSSAANELGRPLYNERIFTINMLVKAKDIYELQRKLSKISVWLCGSGELIFDDMPAVVWDASVISGVDYAPEREGRKAILSVSFNVKPFSRAVCSAENITIGTRIPIGSKIPIGLRRSMTHTFNAADITDDNKYQYTFNLVNIGSAHTKPVITISGIAGNMAGISTEILLEVNSKPLSVSLSLNRPDMGGTLIVDMEKSMVTLNRNALAPDSGYLSELKPGENVITVSISNADTVTADSVSVSYVPRFLYGWEV